MQSALYNLARCRPRFRGLHELAGVHTKRVPKHLRTRPFESFDKNAQISKTMSWLLRHGATENGIPMRSDGYVLVQDLLKHPALRGVDFLALENIVHKDMKMRYHLLFEPSIPGSSSSVTFSWWIRANQGHSLSDIAVDLQEITSADQIPMAVHGTSQFAWHSIAAEGLSKMNRKHIHMAQEITGNRFITGMRHTAQVLIYVDIRQALAAGIKFYQSSNGVVLTEGDSEGFIRPSFFENVKVKVPKPGLFPEWKDLRELHEENEARIASIDKANAAVER